MLNLRWSVNPIWVIETKTNAGEWIPMLECIYSTRQLARKNIRKIRSLDPNYDYHIRGYVATDLRG